ncbi:phosphoglucosamine mutase [Saccharicrinis fermentans]|uniref:Phosphomannomutase/phosphoglucomutase n=1 Tax=Saccharicrinis fermentans DSM 9555 = JCM 21142 TaxID=869213 RepID=W7YQP7_9BACT|nr:phosphoglucosamine mutase [Saccharicrinis fermentans]GAF04749.1 phosphomannomutase/phosphoglucomutase [Saccharicrinis fermentans DSM 9555 = JCM 21142]
MTLIKSISGIRGTIGGKPGDGLSPLDIVKFTAAYAVWAKRNAHKERITVVVGRDARMSGAMVDKIVVGTLIGSGIDVINLGLSTTPTTELAVTMENADGGIILTASHNPKQWNALKLLNSKGEFLSATDGEMILKIADAADFSFADVDYLGSLKEDDSYLQKHIDHVCALDLVDVEAIRSAHLTVALDCVNSTGGIYLPPLLKALGVKNVIELFCEPNGQFPHNPEPLPENLTEISALIKDKKADVGFVVDPDVDRLAIVNEDGSMFGEEYTLVAVSDYVLSQTKGNTVSNLSSTRALRDVTQKHGGSYSAAAVGEVNVVSKMKETHAVIGGEGNGGIIYPASHYGRDALVGIGLFLTLLAKSGKSCSQLRASYPSYFISKNKIQLTPELDVDKILAAMKAKYSHEQVNDIDGVKIDFPDRWVHLRKSNTEPIIRIYSEASSDAEADELAQKIIADIKEVAGI